jgi:hypothetical protein
MLHDDARCYYDIFGRAPLRYSATASPARTRVGENADPQTTRPSSKRALSSVSFDSVRPPAQ